MKSWIYFARYGENGPIKIGRANDPHERVSSLSCGTPMQIFLLGAMISDNAKKEESELQQQLKADHIKGEWFSAEAVLKRITEFGMRVLAPAHVTSRLLENDSTLTEDLHIRVNQDELDTWKIAARREGFSLSEWLRRKLNARAVKTGVCP